jgi:hypothetical protein
MSTPTPATGSASGAAPGRIVFLVLAPFHRLWSLLKLRMAPFEKEIADL